MRRIATGGMRLSSLSDEERQELKIESPMALQATSVGKFGAHAAAQRAGFKVDDVIIEFDGQTDLGREADLFAYVNDHHQPGDVVRVKVMRSGKVQTLELPIQK